MTEPTANTPPPDAPSTRGDSSHVTLEELQDVWFLLSQDDRLQGFLLLPRPDAEELFLAMTAHDQADLLLHMPAQDRRSWMRFLAPDDAADLIQHSPPEKKDELLALLDDVTRREVTVLLAYAEDDAGGLMSPRFARVRPEMTVDESISYLRKQAAEKLETIYYVYVLDAHQKLLGLISFRELFASPGARHMRDVMHTDIVTVREDMDQESVSRVVKEQGFLAVPVVDAQGIMKGIVTLDDIVDVVDEEATEDIQKLGGMEALDEPYLETDFFKMLRKRGGWLAVLFLGEMLTATAMGHYEDEIKKAVVLALFIPLIISSGGNSGSQATTLVIRAMALGEVRLRDWWRVVRREFAAGLALGGALGLIGFLRIVVWGVTTNDYGPHYLGVAFTVAISLVGVVMFGTLSGSGLPFLMRRLGLDPASASAPFVATLVDVSGLVIYFSVASVLLRGTLL